MIRFISKCILVLISMCTQLQAQIKQPKYEVGIAVGGFIYQGDLAPSRLGSWKTIRPGLILHGSRKINSTLAVRLNFSWASLRGNDAKYSAPSYHQQRNFNFRTPLIELTPQIVWSPMGWEEVGPKLTPYAFAGAGLGFTRIRRDWSNFNPLHFGLEEDLPQRILLDAAHRTPVLLPVIPVGAGIRYAVSPQIVLNAELNYRTTFTDYLDGFSRAANPKRKDHFYSISVGAIYRFGKKNSWDCPPVR